MRAITILILTLIIACNEKREVYINTQKGVDLEAIRKNEVRRDTTAKKIFLDLEFGMSEAQVQKRMVEASKEGLIEYGAGGFAYRVKPNQYEYYGDISTDYYGDHLGLVKITLKSYESNRNPLAFLDMLEVLEAKYGEADYLDLNTKRAVWIDGIRQIDLQETGGSEDVKITYLDNYLDLYMDSVMEAESKKSKNAL